ncbi:MAG: hypothetical protein ACLPOA_06505, partial [Methylocella sp.]
SAPAAARVLLSLIWGITTGCLSYAPKGKLPAGVCLIIIGTEGRLPEGVLAFGKPVGFAINYCPDKGIVLRWQRHPC